MAILFARCPRTRRLIDTRVSVDEDTLVQTANDKAAVYCEDCDRFHVMLIREMFCAPEHDEEAA